jgi:hypothetical protein
MTLTFEGEEGIPAVSLAKYLAYFRAVYGAIEGYEDKPALQQASPEHYRTIWKKLPREALYRSLYPFPFYFSRARYPLASAQWWKWENEYERRYRREETLRIEAISKESPLVITLCGVAIALAAAVILSGGSIDFSLKGIKCRLPPLGKGLEALRRALRKKM